LIKGPKYEFVGKKIKTNMESSRGENQSKAILLILLPSKDIYGL
jgi:hypothetical protein